MTKTEIKERYKEELNLIKERTGFNDKELEIYIDGYTDGQNCLLEWIKSDEG